MSKPRKTDIEKLIDTVGGRFSTELGIDLSNGESSEIFKWFLASKLMGARISTDIAMRTYRAFEKRGITTPNSIIETGWDGLVKILDDGGYVRYDFSTATRLLGIAENLMREYAGDLNRLHKKATDEKELETLLKELGKGIGDVTVNIFLRELRGIWEKARPALSEMARLGALNLELIKNDEDPLPALEKFWSKNRVEGRDFRDFEAALLRMGKSHRRK